MDCIDNVIIKHIIQPPAAGTTSTRGQDKLLQSESSLLIRKVSQCGTEPRIQFSVIILSSGSGLRWNVLPTKVDPNHVMFCPGKLGVVYDGELTKSAMFATCMDSLMTSRRERPGLLSNWNGSNG